MTEAKTDDSTLPINQILCGDCVEIMKTLPTECIDLTMFSPPYWGLRDYGINGQIGLENHPAEYIAKMVQVCQEIKRLLKKTGSMYSVIGDTYFGGKGKSGSSLPEETDARSNTLQRGYQELSFDRPQNIVKQDGCWLQPKQLMGIPWRVAIALQEDGWILRNDIIWNKPNHMPSSVRDRLTNAYEHIFHFVKSRKYYYDLGAIRIQPNNPAEMTKYRSESRIKKAKRFGRRESLFQKVPTEAPHRSSKDVIGRYEGKFNGFGEESEKFGSPRACTQRFQTQKEPYIKNNPHLMRLEPEKHVALDSSAPMDLSHPLGKNPSDVLKLDSIACPSGPQRWEREGTNRVEARFHPDGKNPSDVLLYDSKYAKHEYGQTLQAFVREQSIAKRRILSRVEAEKLFPNDPEKQQEYINYVHDHDGHPAGPNPADFWNITTKPFKGAHFAVYPEAVCVRPILSSCPPDGVVLDPMCGSGTTLAVAKKLGRKYLGIELNPAYIEIANKRLSEIPEKITSFL